MYRFLATRREANDDSPAALPTSHVLSGSHKLAEHVPVRSPDQYEVRCAQPHASQRCPPRRREDAHK